MISRESWKADFYRTFGNSKGTDWHDNIIPINSVVTFIESMILSQDSILVADFATIRAELIKRDQGRETSMSLPNLIAICEKHMDMQTEHLIV